MTASRLMLLWLTCGAVLVAQDRVVRGWAVRYLESMQYPALARASEAQGQVVLSCDIDGDGSVKEVRVIAPQKPPPGLKLLVNAALENVKRWTFRKSLDNGAEEPPLTLIYVFRLEGMCAQSCETKFSFEYPNLVTVVGQFRPLSLREYR